MEQLANGLYFVKTQKEQTTYNGIACVRGMRVHIFNYTTMTVVEVDDSTRDSIEWGELISNL